MVLPAVAARLIVAAARRAGVRVVQNPITRRIVQRGLQFAIERGSDVVRDRLGNDPRTRNPREFRRDLQGATRDDLVACCIEGEQNGLPRRGR